MNGADYSAFDPPYFKVRPKEDRGHYLKVEMIGLLKHSAEDRLRLFTMTANMETVASHVIETVHRSLNDSTDHRELPPTLYFQSHIVTGSTKPLYVFRP